MRKYALALKNCRCDNKECPFLHALHFRKVFLRDLLSALRDFNGKLRFSTSEQKTIAKVIPLTQ